MKSIALKTLIATSRQRAAAKLFVKDVVMQSGEMFSRKTMAPKKRVHTIDLVALVKNLHPN